MYYNRLETVKTYFKETETKTIILTFRDTFKRLDEQNGVPKNNWNIVSIFENK